MVLIILNSFCNLFWKNFEFVGLIILNPYSDNFDFAFIFLQGVAVWEKFPEGPNIP